MLHQLGTTVASLQSQLSTTLSTVDYKMLLLHRRLAAVEVHLNLAAGPLGAGSGPSGQLLHAHGGEHMAGGVSFSGSGVGPLGPAVSSGRGPQDVRRAGGRRGCG